MAGILTLARRRMAQLRMTPRDLGFDPEDDTPIEMCRRVERWMKGLSRTERKQRQKRLILEYLMYYCPICHVHVENHRQWIVDIEDDHAECWSCYSRGKREPFLDGFWLRVPEPDT